jgi:exosortase
MDKSVGLRDALKTFYPLLILIAAVELLIWAHWNSLLETASWWDNPKYSHGYLVPLFAGVLLYLRRDETVPIIKSLATLGGALLGAGLLLCVLPFVLPDSILTMGFLSTDLFESIGVTLSAAGGLLLIQQRIAFSEISASERWIGFGILSAGEVMRLWATHTSHYSPERFSFILALVGIFVMVGGMRIMHWAGWPITFLIFMLPLPAALDSTLSASLQTEATASSTFLLQTVGVGAVRSGSVISVGRDGIPMNVEEACSGLRMLTIFGALSFAVVLLADFPMWQRIVILLSAVPIALAANIIRITATGILFTLFPAAQEKLKLFFHDGAGLVMMPLAMLLLFLEYKILSNLFVEDEDDLVQPLGLGTLPQKVAAGAGPVAKVAPAARPAAPMAMPGKLVSGKTVTAKPMPANPIAAKPIAAKPIAAKPIATKPPAPQPQALPSAGPRQSASNR